MKEGPVLFKGEMVRAILEGRKTQTRRAVKVQPPPECIEISNCGGGEFDMLHYVAMGRTQRGHIGFIKCPYGKPGDRLWVKESHFLLGRWEMNGKTKTGKDKWRFFPFQAGGVLFPENKPKTVRPNTYRRNGWYKRNSLFMPRWASRITLEITGIRVERLDRISDDDALAEGILEENCIVGCHCAGGYHQEVMGVRYFHENGNEEGYESADDAYKDLWESINGPGSWDANPWVWVIEFKRVTP